MGLLSRAVMGAVEDAGGYGPANDYWYNALWPVTKSGQVVTPESALRVTAALACVRVISEAIASLPLLLYERTGEDRKRRATNESLYDVLRYQPNRKDTPFEFKEFMQVSVLLRGDGFAEIISGARGYVDELIPLHPDCVTVEIMSNGLPRYRVRDQSGQERILRDDQMFRVRGMTVDGIRGVSPIAYARESLGIALAAEEYGARFFANDATPTGIITHPAHFENQEAADRFVRDWRRLVSGKNRGSVGVLEDGLTYNQISMKNSDAQFLETRKFQVRDIARIFRVQPHLIADLENATFTNIEHQGIEFVVHTMTPWFVRWEQAISRDLIPDEDVQRLYAEFLVDALLRGDTKSRYEAFASGIVNGWLTRNEVRLAENRDPIDGLDEPLQPLNMTEPNAPKAELSRLTRKEAVALSEARDRFTADADFKAWCVEFYQKFRKHVREVTGLGLAAANSYCVESFREAVSGDMVQFDESWENRRHERLEALMREGR